MDLNTITVADFKSQFPRGFPYLPVYNPAALYNAGSRVYYATALLFYDCLVNGTMGVTPGTDATVWQLASDDTANYVQDSDITAAFAEAQAVCNQDLFSSDAGLRLGYLYLTAHYLCHDLKAAGAGFIAAASFPVTGRTVGSVSESYGVPVAYLENPLYSFYTGSAYGLKYLSMVLPALVGNVGSVQGWTDP